MAKTFLQRLQEFQNFMRKPAEESEVRKKYFAQEEKGLPVENPYAEEITKGIPPSAPEEEKTLEQILDEEEIAKGIPPSVPEEGEEKTLEQILDEEAAQDQTGVKNPPLSSGAEGQTALTLENIRKLQQQEPQSENMLEDAGFRERLRENIGQLDLSPWAALADKFSGRGNQLTTLAAAEAKKKEEGADLARQLMISKRQQERHEFELANKFSADLDKVTKPYWDIKAQFPQLKAALTSTIKEGTNAGAVKLEDVNRILGLIIYAGGGRGAQTEKDVERAFPPSFMKWLASVKYQVGGEDYLPAKYVAGLQKFVQNAESSWNKSTEDRMGAVAKRYKRRYPEYSATIDAEMEDFADILISNRKPKEDLRKDAKTPAPAPAPATKAKTTKKKASWEEWRKKETNDAN